MLLNDTMSTSVPTTQLSGEEEDLSSHSYCSLTLKVNMNSACSSVTRHVSLACTDDRMFPMPNHVLHPGCISVVFDAFPHLSPSTGADVLQFTKPGLAKGRPQLETIEIRPPSFPLRKPRLPGASWWTNIPQLGVSYLTKLSVWMVVLQDWHTVETCNKLL